MKVSYISLLFVSLSQVLLLLLLLFIYSLRVFYTNVSWWPLTGVRVTASLFKFSQVSRILCSILANLSNAVVWMVLARLPISNFSSPLTKPLRAVPRVPAIIGSTLTIMFHIFSVLQQGSSTYLSFCFLCFSLCSPPSRQSPLFGGFSFFS